MKKILRIVLVIILAFVVGGLIYWQVNKKNIIEQSIEKAVTKKTDSLYYLHYDSSRIDEMLGNATFYNLVLQSDSAQKALLNSTDSLPNALYNIRIKQVSVNSVDIPGFLQKATIAAKSIVLLQPVFQIINTGAGNPKPYTANDTLELYQKMLGKFNSINADTVRITNGTLLITNKEGKAQTTLENINITLNKFLVDSTKDYHSIISYFIKDIRVTVENIQLPPSKNGSRINLENVDYNAVEKYLQVSGIKQYEVNNMKPVTDLKNIQIRGLNTDAFILRQQLKAGQISCEGGVITIYVRKKAGKVKGGDQSIELSTDVIGQAEVAGITLGSTKVIIINQDEPAKAPFVLSNTRFKLTKMLNIIEGASIGNLIDNAEWELSADGFSLETKSKLYKISMGDFTIDNKSSVVKIKNFLFTPLVTEKQFVKQSRFQQDQYNLAVNNITFSGINIKKLINNKEFEIDQASFQPEIKVFNDRTLPAESKSKLGNYPHQQVLKLPFPIYIHTLKINNGLVSYREKAVKSKQTGNILFKDINATLSNVTNIPGRIKTNPLFKINASAKFLGAGNLTSEWQFPLDATNGEFRIKGRLGNMDAAALNTIIEPLAMASVKTGKIDEVSFSLNGTDTKSTADILFLYHDLKMEMLKKEEDATFKKKGLVSLLANALIKNANSNRSKIEKINYERDQTRSFFNLVWKTVFAGVKKTAM
ncbi:MAG: hypothetical protein WKI04_15615 [Ferruginibacter sp.]